MTAASASDRLSGGGMFIKKVSGWFIALAAVFMFLGILAIIEPGVAGLAVTIVAGWVLIFGGVTHFVAAFSGGGVGRVIWQSLIGFVYVVGGYYFVTHPLLGLGSLTLLLACVLLAEAVFESFAYFRMRGAHGAGWILVDAFFALILSALIWNGWPSSSVWAIGTLLGVKLLMTGASRLAFGLASKRIWQSNK
jgi:uncharacterized membrane protein HdeD (DUF308 family)